jgi:hypothetical protein
MRVDGRTAASTRDSIAAIEKGLSKQERKSLSDAILKIRIANPEGAYDSKWKGPNVLIDDAMLGRRIDGMTFQQILELASH